MVPEEFRLKSAILALSILLLATVAFAQEPVNNAVQQPTLMQPTALQPTLNEPSVLQIVTLPPSAPYLSEPLVIPPKQVVAHERPHPVVTDPRQSVSRQPLVCGCHSE